jgi:hypothetical protein
MSRSTSSIAWSKSLLAFLCWFAIWLAPASTSAELAVFTDGRILHIEDAFLRGEQIVLKLHGGGSLIVPAQRVDRVISDVLGEISDSSPSPTRSCEAHWAAQDLPPDTPFIEAIRQAAQAANLNPQLLASLVRAESAFDPDAVSRVGARGLTQLMPSAALDHGVTDPFDVDQNLAGGAAHLRRLLDRFGNLPHALAAYNAGAATVDRYDGIPPYRETQTYVRRVLRLFCPEEQPQSKG